MAQLLRLPEIATGTTEAVLSSWSVAENASVAAHDVVAVVETAKAVVDVEAETDGVLLRLLVQPGAEVETGAPIALVASPGETVTDVDAALAELGVTAGAPATAPSADPGALEVPEASTTPEPSPVDQLPAPVAAPSNGHGTGRVFASPLARRLAREAGLSVEHIPGSGPHGRIVRRDVELARRSAPTAPPTQVAGAPPTAGAAPTAAGAAAYTEVPHTRLRKLIAARLTESTTTAPHFYLRASVQVDRLLALRAEINDAGGRGGAETRVSVNDLVVKAVATAHVLVPSLNVTWTAEAVRAYSSVDVAVAVATDKGLVTPVVRSVQDLSVTALSRTARDLAERARAGRLQQHELEGGSISVTNLGMYGTEEFAAIINPPQASILAVGAARQEPVVVDGALSVATVMRLTLSVDHRPVDGVAGAEWLRTLVDLLEHPARILA
jgi:pyruvate dehydrogenase E2 component (dihydrolipoamide acetyltransferase)